MARNIDILIVGQGLAGSLLALEFDRLGFDYLIADNGWIHSSSTAAAGLINPVTGQRLVKTRHLEQLLPAALETYGALERELGVPLFHPRPMIRLLREGGEADRLEMRLGDPGYEGLLGPRLGPAGMDVSLAAPLGGFEQYQAGFVDLPLLLQGLRARFSAAGRLLPEEIDAAGIRLEAGSLRYKEILAGRVVFCEGYRGKDNPWFGYLPFQPDKGEILMLEFERALPRCIINGATWLVPVTGNRYRLGSTHEHRRLDEQPTEKCRRQLIASLPALLKSPPGFRLIEHRAGVRPATRGAEPFIGHHPEHPGLSIFNGFGAKGSLSIPWHARRFAEYLGERGPLPPHADIGRFPFPGHR
ncbi:MAG: hypothetical protein A2286_10225 [Gammaproteobacteria bacterium RIFOXYA12_FULL_61_12]|nr:MAG: hypothetical protein A2514_04885 [Gammaproteobacteria bacterium RIFOXYD12_FULL_61_37]OGT94338.1 MAG: hypothetical protein A2286_10225 [Gammaproteobacteria bacterium RIFOXYA12_FULL_61_12]